MITKIRGEQPFQVLTDSFSISPSQEGYTLQISADGKQYSNLFTVGAGVTRLVTGVAANSYYRLSGNQSDVSVNWMRSCGGEGGGGGAAGNELAPVSEFPLGAAPGTVVAYSGASSASGIYMYDGTDWNPAGGDIDLSNYYTSAQTEEAISAATSGKADAANVQTYGNSRYFPKWNEQGVITDTIGSVLYETTFPINNEPITATIIRAGWNIPLPHIYAPTTSGNAGEVLVSLGDGGAPVWSAFTGGDSKTVVDFDKTTQAERASLYTELKTLYDGGSGATINKNYDFFKTVGTKQGLKIDYYTFSGNTMIFGKVVSPDNSGETAVYAQVLSIDSAGNVNVVTNTVGGGAGTGYWTSAETKTYVDSAITGVQDQIDTIDNVIPAAILDLNDRVATISAATPTVDLSGYYTSAQTEEAISSALTPYYTSAQTNTAISAVTQDMVTSTTVRQIVKLTQAEYDVLTPKDPYTFYIISNSN